jgi:D-3-phosphoglycerate dehydrogenase
MDDPYLTLFRYSDVPGMVGRVGSALGAHGVNISAAAVGREAPGEGDGHRSDLAVMAVSTDAPVPAEVVAEVAASEGFVAGRTIALRE